MSETVYNLLGGAHQVFFTIGMVTIIISLIMIPIALFSRGIIGREAGKGIYYLSYIVLFACWFYSAQVALYLGGWILVLIGFCLLLVGIIPMGVIVAAVNGEWIYLFLILTQVGVFFLFKYIGIFLMVWNENKEINATYSLNDRDSL